MAAHGSSALIIAPERVGPMMSNSKFTSSAEAEPPKGNSAGSNANAQSKRLISFPPIRLF